MKLKALITIPLLSLVLSFSVFADSHTIEIPDSDATLKTELVTAFNLEIARSQEIQAILQAQKTPNSIRSQPPQIRLRTSTTPVTGLISKFIMLESGNPLFVQSTFEFTQDAGKGIIKFERISHRILN